MATVIAVKLHSVAQRLWFDPKDSDAVNGDRVIVKTKRGTEIGVACTDAFNIGKSKIKAVLKPVLRVATGADLARAEELEQRARDAMPVFKRLAKQHGLDIKPIDAEFLFDGEKAVFYFTSDERVDFRALVRELASEFHIRVEMRQIGSRDEAQLIGGLAPCGQEFCCTRMASDHKPVSIRMAKEQDLSLNPAKISGFCGKLMCCLRYEVEAYKDYKQRAPKPKATVETPLGYAKVVGFDTPRELVGLRLEDGKTFYMPLCEMSYEDGTTVGDYDDHAPKSAAASHAGKAAERAAGDGADDAGDGGEGGEGVASSAGACAAAQTASGKPCCPGRPCVVSREALERCGGTQIAMALAAFDREHGISTFEEYSEDLVEEIREKPKRRKRAGAVAELGEEPSQPRAQKGIKAKADAQGRANMKARKPRRTHGGDDHDDEQAKHSERKHVRPPRNASKSAKLGDSSEGAPRSPRRRHHGAKDAQDGSGGAHAKAQARQRPGQRSSGLRAAVDDAGSGKQAKHHANARRKHNQSHRDSKD